MISINDDSSPSQNASDEPLGCRARELKAALHKNTLYRPLGPTKYSIIRFACQPGRARHPAVRSIS